MSTDSRVWHRRVVPSLLSVLLAATILVAQMTPILAPPASAGILQTVGDFLSLGANTARELQTAIELASAETKEILEQIKRDIEAMTEMLEEKFQNNLNFALTSLDATTQNILFQLEDQITTINALLQENIELAGQVASDTIRQGRVEIQITISDLEQSLQRSVLFVGITGTYLLDRTVNLTILIIAVVMLGLGLLVFIWLLYRQHMPVGLARSLVFGFAAAFFILFGALLIPPTRALAMTVTGVGLERQLDAVAARPRIIDVVPTAIMLGQTTEVEVWGTMLRPNGTTPTATIAGVPVPVKAAVDNLIIVDVATLSTQVGPTSLELVYDGHETPGAIVSVAVPEPSAAPADLQIANFVIDPAAPEPQGSTQATIEVCNRGGSEAANFVVQWKPTADHPGLSQRVPTLGGGECTTRLYLFSYPSSGTVDTVAQVDAFNNVDETDETNNIATARITVQPERSDPPPVRTLPPLPPANPCHPDPPPPPNGQCR